MFKVGDRVKTKENGNGTVIGTQNSFTGQDYLVEHDNKQFCGHNGYNKEYVSGGKGMGNNCWWYLESGLTLIPSQKILITHDGHTTLARLYEGNAVVKSAEAKCHPNDTFDFGVGAGLAFAKLMEDKPVEKPEPVNLYCIKSRNFFDGSVRQVTRGKVYEIDTDGYIVLDDGEKYGMDRPYKSFADFAARNPSTASCLIPLISRPARVGEWVYFVDYMGGGLLPGTIHRCTQENKFGIYACSNPEKYLVIDGYQPEPERCKCCGQVIKD